VPALQAAKTDFNEVLKEAGRGGMEGRSRSRLRNILVVSEFALALLLLTVPLMIKAFDDYRKSIRISAANY
jgi:putative ABC transport system permease protein